MGKRSLFFLFIFTFFILPQVSALGGYIGENPGFDFYSKIDENARAIEEKLVTAELRNTPRLENFGRNCDQRAKKFLTGKMTNEKLLKELQGQYYAGLSQLLAGEKGITTDDFSNIARCLADSYTTVQTRVQASQERIEITSQAGLYSDGDTRNSEYDIIADIEKINGIIFSTELRYTGTQNASSKSLRDVLAGHNPGIIPLTGSMSPLSADISTGDSSLAPTSPILGDTGSPSLSSLLGSTCRDTASISGPVDSLMDTSFAIELSSILSGVDSLAPDGYSASERDPIFAAERGSLTTLTGGSDFSDKMPCGPGQMFCIDVKTVPGGNISLGGGRNYSIEGILDKYSKHLYPISESDLSYKRMTNQNAQSTEKNAKFTFAGLKVYLAEKGQRSRVDKNEETPARAEDKLQAILDCANITSGLPANAKEANMLVSGGFRMSTQTTNNILGQVTPIGTQDAVEATRQIHCYQNYMNEGRRIYANSLSTDLTDFQAFTNGLITEITDIIGLLKALGKK